MKLALFFIASAAFLLVGCASTDPAKKESVRARREMEAREKRTLYPRQFYEDMDPWERQRAEQLDHFYDQRRK